MIVSAGGTPPAAKIIVTEGFKRMEHPLYQRELADGVRIVGVQTSRFKTLRVSVSFAVQLCAQTAGVNALVISMLQRSCARYPDFTALNKRLAELYGAIVYARITKQGDVQVLTLYISTVDDRFALEGEKLADACAGLLCDMLFNPVTEGGLLPEQAVEMEKRLLKEKIDSELSDKRQYALEQCEAAMCAGEPFGLSKYGKVSEIDAITPQMATDAMKKLLRTAQVQINVIGSADAQAVGERFRQAFEQLGRDYRPLPAPVFGQFSGTVREQEEQLPVNQGKLVLGLRTGMESPADHVYANAVMTDIFGGGPYSRLFMNVREKLSLCYYCSARLTRQKGLIFVSSGVESENAGKARAEILNQLQVMKDGRFEDSEFAASVKALSDSARSMNDMPDYLDTWYTRQMTLDAVETPEEYARQISAVTREQVEQAACSVALDTVYLLKPNEKEAQS